MTDWARRPERETPRMEQRLVRDETGRTWIGNVSSGTSAGGEERAEVVFICVDQPAELKRVGSLDVAAGGADAAWRNMAAEEVQRVFRRSEAA